MNNEKAASTGKLGKPDDTLHAVLVKDQVRKQKTVRRRNFSCKKETTGGEVDNKIPNGAIKGFKQKRR